MSDAVMAPTLAENASVCQALFADFSNAPRVSLRHKGRVLGSKEILGELERRGVEKKDIARVLGVDASQITRLFSTEGKPRKLQHDEAVRLVEEYGLEQGPDALPVHPALLRLLVHHVAATLGLPLELEDPRVATVTVDLAALAVFVRDPSVKDLVEAAEMYFRALRTRAQNSEEGPPETDPQPDR